MSETNTVQSFNLVDDPWVSCQMMDGTISLLSLRQVFEDRASIRQLSGDSPQQDYAVMRVLLAIFWRTHQRLDEEIDYPDDWWADLFEQVDEEEFVGPILDYLDEWKERFELFDATAPFMQAGTLETSKGVRSGVRRLIPEAELDYFTLRAGSGRETLTFAEAARWLIAIHAWDYSGIKPGAWGDPRVKGGKGYPIGTGWSGNTGGIVIHGDNLGQTLLLNTDPSEIFPSREEALQDAPAWEREAQTSVPRDTDYPAGPCDVLTWQTRRVRLFTDEGLVTGVLVTNGDKIEIRNQFADPMTAYRYSKNQSKKGAPVLFAKTHAEERTLWRGIDALLIRELADATPAQRETSDRRAATIERLATLKSDRLISRDQTIRVELVGFVYGPQSSIITESIHEVIPFKLTTFLEDYSSQANAIVSGAQQAVAAAINLGQFAGFLKEAAGDTYEFVPGATERVLHDLQADFKRWLISFTPETDAIKARNAWYDLVESRIKEHATVLTRSAGQKALIGRVEESESATGSPRVFSTATALDRLHRSLKKTLERTGETR
ncbi:type I-E CRISPR-associated protein Cse1/CasA [Rothia sp. LK2588]|uniref:type I-E CRISPR-associated protein Cse1/CasA n=1 Tax=Rothia sp. LK2588 TaxID=3114369 RepID=UPI0034CE4C59